MSSEPGAGQLSDIASVGFKVENFNRANMAILESNWPKITDTLKLTADLVGSFGLSRDTIRADSALLPVAYYLHRKGAQPTYVNSPRDASDRSTIKTWLIRSLIKRGIWGSALDVLLTALREVLKTDASGKYPSELLEREMRTKGKTLEFTQEEIEDIADKNYGDHDLTSLMILLFPFVDTASNQFHVDHIFPRSSFHARKLKQLGFSEDKIAELQDKKERLANLQLLQGQLNQSKSGQMPKQWMDATFSNSNARNEYVQRHMLNGAEVGIDGFLSFYDGRRTYLTKAIKDVLNPP